MLINATIADIISLFIDVFLLYFTFFFLFCKNIKKSKLVLYLPTIIIGCLFGMLLNDFFKAITLTSFFYYLFLYKIFLKKRYNFNDINEILLFLIIESIITFLVNFPINVSGYSELHRHIVWIPFAELLEIIITIIIFRKINLALFKDIFSNTASKEIFLILISTTFAINAYFMYMYHTNTYSGLILVSLFLLTMVTIILVLVFIFFKKYFDARYKEQLSQQQLNSMVQYTEVIERNQLQLRRFKHDYKNILLAMITMVEENKIDELKQYMASLTEYSQHHLTQSIEQYRDLHNIRHQLLKSMITMKLMELDSLNISFTFECLEPIEQLAIDDFDLVRMVGILLDNAKEYLQEIGTGHVNFLIIKTDELIEISIANTYLSDDKSIEHFKEMHYSSKSGHDGLGLSNIEEIKQKYDNIFIQYEKNDTFTVKIILLNHEGR